jgi:hypothetical protein
MVVFLRVARGSVLSRGLPHEILSLGRRTAIVRGNSGAFRVSSSMNLGNVYQVSRSYLRTPPAFVPACALVAPVGRSYINRPAPSNTNSKQMVWAYPATCSIKMTAKPSISTSQTQIIGLKMEVYLQEYARNNARLYLPKLTYWNIGCGHEQILVIDIGAVDMSSVLIYLLNQWEEQHKM